MKTKHKMSAILAILFLVVSIFTVIQLPVYASGSADVWVGSVTYSYDTKDIGDPVVLPVEVNSTDEVVTWEANFTFDPNILNCASVFEGSGSYLKAGGSTNFISGTINNVAGTITGVNCTATGGQNATGYGVLVYLVFTVKSFGTTIVTIDIDMRDTVASPIAVTETDGYFGMALTVSLPSVSYFYDTNDVGDTVVMPLEIEASSSTSWGGVISWEANFTFDPNILNCASVFEGSYLKAGGSTNFISGTINNVAGTITGVNCTATGGQKPTGSGVLAYLVFTVIDLGSTNINITDISVLVGDPHEALVNAVDGYFEMGITVSLPAVNWWYPDHNIGEVVVMELSIEAPEAANWTGGVVSWQADFSFNPNILNCIGVSNGTYLAGLYLNWTNIFTNGTIDNNAGTVTGVNGTLTQAGKNATGSGILAYLAFNVTGTGSTYVTIADCTVLVSGPREAPPTLVHGHFALGITVSLPAVNWWYPDHNIGEVVVMELSIVTPELYAWQAGFTFDPTILQCLSVSQGPYLQSAGWTLWLSGTIDNVNGVVTPFGCSLGEQVGAGPTGAGGAVLATLTFNVTGFGSTTITLTDCKAVSPVCTRIIPLTVIDGYFKCMHVKQPIKIGVIGPMDFTQGQGMWEGANLAAEEINATGGILGGNVTLVFADTLRGQLYPDNETGAAAAMELMDASCDFVVGGCWSESVFAAREVFMDHEKIFLIAGAAEDDLIDCVGENYTRYKYLFRVAPFNSTTLAEALWNFSRFVLESKLFPYCEVDGQVKVAIVSENLTLWDEMHENMTNPAVYPYVLGPYANVTCSARININQTDFSGVLANVSASGARLLIHLFSTQAGINFTKQWAESGVNAIPVGINIEAQNMEFWEQTDGKCEYETILAPSGTRTPLSAKALAFYDETLSQYGHSPILTSWGAYEAIHTLAEAIERVGTTDSDTVVAELEQTDRNGTLGRFKFTEYHDVFCNELGENWEEGYVRPLVCQWQKSPITGKARLKVVWPRDQGYSTKWKIPAWISPIANFDINNDGMISVVDILHIKISWGTVIDNPFWDLECDFDGNCIINVAELLKIMLAFGYGASQSQSMVGVSDGKASSIPTIAQTNAETTVYLDPSTINGTSIGEEFTVNIMVSDALDIRAWQAGLIFNATLLECTEFWIGDFYTGSLDYKEGEIHNDIGVVDYSGCAFDDTASGNGTLAYAAFRVKTPGVSNIHLRDVMVMDLTPSPGGEDFRMVPSKIIDTYTITRSPAQTVFTVSNSTGLDSDPDDCRFVNNTAVPIIYGSGFYSHAFSRPDEEISFNVIGPYRGWSNVTIPKTLLNVSTLDQLLVIIDDIPLKTEERTATENDTHYFVYFNYIRGIHSISILKRPPVYNINKNRYYATIQKAINSAQPQHKILAYAGKHYENVVVNKSVTLVGENKHNTIIDGSGTGTVINVTANNVNISDFTIRNSGNPECGILAVGSSGNNISHTIMTNNSYGIRLVNSNNNTLEGNTVSNNEYGISLDGSSNTLTNNTVSNNEYGISLHFSSNSVLTNNTMSCNKYNFGLYGAIETHFNNTIDESNTVDGKLIYYVKNASKTVYNSSTNAGTLYLINCTNITIRNFTLTKNVNGIFLWNTKNSTIQNVTTSNNLNGIHLQGQSNNNTLTANTVSNNELGICLDSSNNSVIYHNSFIENTIQANITVSHKTDWDDGYPSGGNYWSDHSIISPFVWDEFKGENQSVQGNDGIIDDPKVIDEENQDNYPLVSPLTPPVYNLNTYLGYTTVQEAIDASNTSNGHTIVARAGTYSENVTISKSLTLIGIMGSTVINGTGTVVTITANSVTLRGFTIQGNGSTDEGIFLSQSNDTVIIENTITTKGYGIWLDQSHNCRIRGNTLNNNTQGGIRLEFSDSAIISRNTLANNSYGIVLSYSSDNAIYRNNVTDNTAVGIKLVSSNNNIIYRNNFIDNTEQVNLFESPNTWDDGGLDLCPICGNPQPKGNYWSDYTGLDDGTPIQAHNCQGDGVGDTDTSHLGVDKYPLMSPRTPQHDVKVASVTPSQTVVASTCRTISITVTVENLGDYTEKFNVTAYYNETAIILPNGKNYTATTVTIESSTIITFTWNAIGIPYGKYVITANATVVPGETDTADNTFEDGWVVVTKVGDVNGDGYVSGADIVNVLINLGPVPPKPPECDVNGDGVISGADIVITLINLG